MIRHARNLRRRREAGLTLAEMMVTSAIFGMAVLGVISCQLFGMRQDQLVNSKIGASEQARRGFNLLADDVRAAKIWQIGNGDGTSFTGIPEGENQRGNALRLSVTTDTNKYYIYYFDTNTAKLFRFHKTSATESCLAEHLTNTMYFQAQNYRGEEQSDPTHKGVVNVVMQFCQYQYPITKVGAGCLYDYYKFELRLTPHVPDGP